MDGGRVPQAATLSASGVAPDVLSYCMLRCRGESAARDNGEGDPG